MPEDKAHELLLTPQLEKNLISFTASILGWSPELYRQVLIHLEKITSKEKYALRQAFLKVLAIEKLNMDPRYLKDEKGTHWNRQHRGLLSEIQIEAIPQPIVEQLRTEAGKISDAISEFFIGRTDEHGITQKNDPEELSITLYGASAETVHATLCTVLESLKKKEGQGGIAGRDTVVFWRMPNTNSDEFGKWFRNLNLTYSTDYGPNIVLILPTPCQRTSSYSGNIYSDSQKMIEEYRRKISEVSRAFNAGGDPPKIAIIYHDINGLSEEGGELKVRQDEETQIPVQAVQSVPLISPKAWAEFPEFKALPERLIQDINSLSEGDILLMKCLLHACHEHMQKGVSAKQMRLTPEIVVVALQNYLQIYGISEAKDPTLLQRLLLLARVVSYPSGIVEGQWWHSAFSGEGRSEIGNDLLNTLSKKSEDISRSPLFQECLKRTDGGVPYGGFVIDERTLVYYSVEEGKKEKIHISYRLNQNLLRVLKWLVGKGHVSNERILSGEQVKTESGKTIFSVVCAYCDTNIDGARIENNLIKADGCICNNCGSKNFRLRVEYIKKKTP